MDATTPIVIAIAAFVLNLLVIAVGGTWRLSRMEVSLGQAIAKSRAEIEERQDKLSRECGDSILAIREKVSQVELFCRDTFMRRDSFYEANKKNGDDMKAAWDRIEQRLDRMEKKIDRT
jgi:hypothetical protein